MKVKLQEQPFQVLAALLEHPGKVVTREELRARLWPADTFVDFDHGLNAAIKRLRDALGESADAPVFVETLAKRGYRFIAPTHDSAAPSGTAMVEPGKTRFWRHWPSAALLLLIMVGVLAWAAWRLRFRPTEVVERKLTTNSPENAVGSAAVSRDGKYLAYADNSGVYLKLIRTGETHAVPLPSDFSARIDDWFPDGSHLLVTRGELPGKLGLWSISVFGGSPRLLADDGRAGSVSPDGSRIAFQRLDFGREEWVMRADGTEQVKVAADKASWVGQPTWSPDGNRIAYIRAMETYNARESSVEVNEWRTSRVQTVFSDNRLCPSVYWLPNGLLVYGIGDEENQQGASLWTVSLQQVGKTTGSSKRIAPRGIGWINQFTGTNDGKVLSFLRENTVVSAYVGMLAPDDTHLLANKRRTFDENKNDPFAWTPDSKAILFHSNRNGTSEIFKQAIDQALPESMMASAEQLQQPRLTPDGSEILFISTPKSATPGTPSSIVAIPISGGPPRLVLRDANIQNFQCANWPSTLCMYSVTKGDTSETFRFDVKTGKTSDPPQVDPLCNWSLSPDGTRRAVVPYFKPDGVIRLRSALTGQTSKLGVQGWDELHSITWSADGKTLFAGWHHRSDSALLRIALDGTVSVLIRSNNPQILGAVPSPDGRFLLIAETSTARNVWQIENF
jgi:Tol biopolymer transport system component